MPTKKHKRPQVWTDERKALLRQIFQTATREELLKAFPERNYAAIASQAQRMGLSRRDWKTARENAAKKSKSSEKTLREKIAEFLSRARTEKEVIRKFGAEAITELAELMNSPPQGFRLSQGKNAFQEKTIYLEKAVGNQDDISVKPRVFQIVHSEKDMNYISVIFPEDLSFSDDPNEDALRIFPIDSSYWGDHLCDRDKLLKFFRYLESKPYAFAFLLGDIIGGNEYTKDTAVEIRDEFRRQLAPIAHKILWAQSGPLEARMRNIDGVDPLHAICLQLNIYHSPRPITMDVFWKHPTKPIEFYCIHGRSQAREAGSKLNAGYKIVSSQNFPHFTVIGHLKDGKVKNLTARRLDPSKCTIKEHSALLIICPGFQKYEGSADEIKGKSPPAIGTVVCIIGADNTHKASS